jgi:hypothetical protein
MNLPPDPDTRPFVEALDDWAQRLDPVQRARLAAARRRALAPAAASRRSMWAGAALVASLAVAMLVGRWIDAAPATQSNKGLTEAAWIEIDRAEREALQEGLDSDLELLLWLDGAEAT